MDLSSGTTQELPAPAGGTFAEVAGGASTVATDASITIVGGTRLTGGPTARVLGISPEGALGFGTLVAAREGACATFVPGRGVIVYGGARARTTRRRSSCRRAPRWARASRTRRTP